MDDIKIQINKTTIEIEGLKKEYKFLQVSDLHILKIDERDGEIRKKTYTERADKYFKVNGVPSYDYLPLFVEYAKKENAVLTLTGDTIDIPSVSGFELLDKNLPAPPDSLFIFGNHDWSFMDYVYWIDRSFNDFRCEKYLKEYYPKFKKYAVNGNLSFQAIELDEIIYAGFDNGGNQFDKEQYEFLLDLAKKNKPIIIFTHVPFYIDSLHPAIVDVWGEKIAEGLAIGGKNSPMEEYTEKFVNSVKNPKNNVCAVVTGHIHLEHDDKFTDTITQYCGDGAYKGTARLFTVKGK